MFKTLSKGYHSPSNGTFSQQRVHSKQKSFSANTQRGEHQIQRRYDQSEDGTQDNIHLTEAVGGPGLGDYVAGKDYPMNSIQVKNTVDVV